VKLWEDNGYGGMLHNDSHETGKGGGCLKVLVVEAEYGYTTGFARDCRKAGVIGIVA